MIFFKIFFLQKRDKLPTKQTKFRSTRDTVRHEIFAGSNFVIFLAICKKKLTQTFSRKNLLPSKYTLTKICYTKIQYYEIVSVQLQLDHLFHPETKTVYNDSVLHLGVRIPYSTVWKYVFLLHPDSTYLTRTNVFYIINAGYWVLFEIAKINSQWEKPMCASRICGQSVE